MSAGQNLEGIREKLKCGAEGLSEQDSRTLAAELEKLSGYIDQFTSGVNGKLATLEADMEHLVSENERLRKIAEGAYFERDATVSLLARLAARLGMTVGRAGPYGPNPERRVVVDLPSGQVSWDFGGGEAHLFDWLPEYEGAVETREPREIYARVMSPGLDG